MMDRHYYIENDKKQSKRTETIIIRALLAILVIIAAGFGTYMLVNKGPADNEYNHYLKLANQYVEAQDYQEAIKNYWIAIEKDQTQERAYINLGSVYEVINEPVNAIDVYNLGYTRTNSTKLSELANNLSVFVYGRPAVYDKDDGGSNNTSFVLNTSFINKIRSFSYSDFVNNYGEPVVERANAKYTASFSNNNITVYYYDTDEFGKVIDTSTNTPKKGHRPNEISLSRLTYIFSDMGDTITYDELVSRNLNGLSKYYDDALSKDVVAFNYEDCKIVIECDDNGNIGVSSWNRIYPNLLVIKQEEAEDEEVAKFDVEGSVIDVVTGEPVGNATITIYNTEDVYTPVNEYTTGTTGDYIFEALPEGEYIVIVTVDGYIEERFDVDVNEWEDNTNVNFEISPELRVGEIRIVLSWNDTPRDLDSYLDGVSSDGSSVHVNYRDQSATDGNGNTVAVLDLDDRDGNGPETITISDVGGNYSYTVRDYEQTGTMAAMGATVKVYMDATSAPIIFEVPGDVVDGWEVFRIRNGELEEINAAVY